METQVYYQKDKGSEKVRSILERKNDPFFKIKEIQLNIENQDSKLIKNLENDLTETINKAIEKSQKNANAQLGSISNLLGM